MPEQLSHRPLWFSILSLIALYFVANVLLGMLFRAFARGGDPAFWTFATYTGSMLVTIGYALVLRRGCGIALPSFRPEKWKADPRVIAVGLVLMLAVSIVLSPLLDRLPDTYVEQLDRYLDGGFWPMFTAVVAAPLLEEFLFRGIIQKNLVRRFGPLGGIAIASVLFGLIHLVPQQIVYASCLGLILGTVYHLTGSLNSAITLHFVNNGLTSLLHMVFGTSVGVEHRLFGDGALWGWSYGISLVLLAGGVWYGIRRLRPDGAKNTTRN